MSCTAMDGRQVRLPRAGRCEQAGPAQVRQRLHAIWLNASEEGMYDPRIDRRRRHSTAEIALLWDVSIRTVQVGIASAKETRERIRELTARG